MIYEILLTSANVCLFVLFAVAFWLLPGSILTKSIPGLTKAEKLFFSLIAGFSFYTLTMYITRLLGLAFWLGYLPSLLLTLLAMRHWFSTCKSHPFKINLNKAKKVFLVIAVSGAIIQSLILLSSGIYTESGLQFGELAFHDSIWHVYLADELKEHFPPRHAGISPASVKNYHFLLDLDIASLTKYLPVSTFELYYRIIPVFVSLLLSLSVFVFTRHITRSEKAANAAVFLTLFSGNASWFFQFFRGNEFRYSSDAFMLDQITFLLHNPHAVLVLPLMLAGISGLSRIRKRLNPRLILFCGLTFGIMIGFKAWGGTLALTALGIAALLKVIKHRNLNYFAVFIVSLLIALVIFLPVYDPQTAARPYFLPGWLLKRMVEDPNRYNYPKYFLLEQYYSATNNLFRLIQINLEEVLIYLFGNLWLRSFGLIYLFYLLKKKFSPTYVFMVVVVVLSLFLPLFFNQGRMAYEIIQFGPYAILLFSIFTAPAFLLITSHLPKKYSLIGLCLLISLTIPSNFERMKLWLGDKKYFISNEELDVYNYIKNNTQKDSVFLLYPSKENNNTAKFSALSQRVTIFSAKTFIIITGGDYSNREKAVDNFFKSMNLIERRELISDLSIDYIFIRNAELANFKINQLSLDEVFSNGYGQVYRILK